MQTDGARERTFSISPTTGQVHCVPKPGLDEWELEAVGEKPADTLTVVFKAFKGPGDYTLEYGVDKPQHVVDVGLEGGFKYRFFQHLRADVEQVYNSTCQLSLAEESAGGQLKRYDGQLSCALLWAAPDSPDYDTDSAINRSIDLTAKFSCER